MGHDALPQTKSVAAAIPSTDTKGDHAMSLQDDVRYLLDRTEIQDKIVLYGLGQDLHQPDAQDKNILEQWNELFTPDAQIDLTDVAGAVFNLHDYAELMRGKGLKGGGLEVSFKARNHVEGHGTVKITGDTATSMSLHIHTHETRDGKASLFDVGYWHDTWLRTVEGWRITYRRHQKLYTNTFPIIANPHFL